MAQYSQEIKRICDANDCGFINRYQAFIEHSTLSIPELTDGLQKDGIHFGLAGYQILAQLILNALN
ncbi:SGNH/GDSL hydrolase family protein [Enterococcus sp. LJL98]